MKILIRATLGVFLIVMGCRTSSAPSKDTSASFYVNPQVHNPIAVVFVHGIFGDAHSSWTASNQFNWPAELAKDKRIAPVDVFVYAFDSPSSGSAYTFNDLVNDFNFTLEVHKVFEKHSTVVFVAHSMGGLVVRAALIRRRLHDKDILNKVPFVYQFSTPGSGAEIASLAKALSNNPQVASLTVTKLQHSTELNVLESDWSAINSRPTKVLCAYEIRETYGILVVPPGSAKISCDGLVDAINADHIDIVKPTSNNSKAYLLVLLALQKIAPPLKAMPPSVKTDSTQSALIQKIKKGDSKTLVTIIVKDQNDVPVEKAQVSFCGDGFDSRQETDSQGVLYFHAPDRTITCPITVQADCCLAAEDSIRPDEDTKTIYMLRQKTKLR